jgi:single-strand DNA-binding protein
VFGNRRVSDGSSGRVMRGLNKVTLAGNVGGDINFATLPGGEPALSFALASDRRASDGGQITVWVRVNVYIAPLITICRDRLRKGTYVLVDGELMNRDGVHGQLTEVRAREILFFTTNRGEKDVERGRSFGD